MAGLAACTEEMEEMVERTIVAVVEEGSVTTRTCVSDEDGETVGILWAPGDAIGVYSASGSENAMFTTGITEPAGEAAFTGQMTNTPKYAYYPYTESNNGKTVLSCELPLIQEYSYSDGILAYDYKVGVPSDKNDGQFVFNHIFALFRISINATGTAVAGERLESVTLTFPDQSLNYGTFTTPVSEGDVTWSNPSQKGNSLTLNWSDKPTMESNKTISGFLNCPPVTGLKGKAITVKLTTSSYVVSFNATVNIDSFAAGYVYSFPLTLSKWEDKSGSNYKEEQLVRPSLTSLSFTAADNPDKILAKKLYYETKKSSGKSGYYGLTSYKTNESETTQKMTINESEGTINGIIPYLFDRNLVPTLTMTSGATLQYSTDGSSFSDWDGQSPIDFSSGNIIRVTKNGMSRDYVVNIKNTGLPVVVIEQPDSPVSTVTKPDGKTEDATQSWDNVGVNVLSKFLDFDEIEEKSPGTIAVYNADGTVDLETTTAMTRLRGNISKSWPKKPFAVKLGTKAGMLGMPKHKRWVLLANWKDKSLMRNHISLGIARLFSENLSDGIPWNVHGQFVEVVYNGVHIGNYYLCEQIKIDENRLNISDPYETKNAFSGNWRDYGYLLECDDYYDETYKFTTDHRIPFMFKDDVDAGNVILPSVKKMILDLESKIYKGYKGTSSTGYSDAYKLLDLASVVDQLLIYEMTMGTEFRHPKSVYMYIDHTGNAETNPKYGKLCAGPVWDFDFDTFPNPDNINESWVEKYGRDFNNSIMAHSSLINTRPAPATSSAPTNGKDSPFMWWPLLMSDDTFTNMAAKRWDEINEIIAGYVSEIEATRKLIAVSWEYNNAMWPACYSEKCDRQVMTTTGFCGDEYLTYFDEVCAALTNAYNKRVSGMNSFVLKKNWPTDAWDNYIK